MRTTGGYLKDVLDNELRKLEYDTDLFTALLRSYPARLTAVKEARGGPTRYQLYNLKTSQYNP